jgi:hypothetical protein
MHPIRGLRSARLGGVAIALDEDSGRSISAMRAAHIPASPGRLARAPDLTGSPMTKGKIGRAARPRNAVHDESAGERS